MIFGDNSGQRRKLQEDARALRVADEPVRARRLHPEIVARWAGVFREAAEKIAPATSPCDYAPWHKAIDEVGPRYGFEPDSDISWQASFFIADASMPAWPEPRPDLIEFAILILECDVMLFRSG